MSLRRYFQRFVGHHVECQTWFGTFRGIVVHCNKHHVILAVSKPHMFRPYPQSFATPGDPRQYPMGPGPGWGGGGWHMAIPLAAIIGITAIGMHWW